MKKFKLFIALITVMSMVLLAVPALAADEGTAVTDTISFTYDEATATLTFSGTGVMPDLVDDKNSDDYFGKSAWYTQASGATKLVIGEGITTIGKYDFAFFTSLTEVVLPESLTSIRAFAFKDIGGATEVSVNIPANAELGRLAFQRTNNNKIKLVFAEGTTAEYIGAEIFSSNSNPKGTVTLVYAGSNEDFADSLNTVNATNRTVVLYDTTSNTLTVNGTGALADLTTNNYTTRAWNKYIGAKYLVIGEGITSIGRYNFAEFSGLRNVTLPETLTTIKPFAFKNIGGNAEVSVNIPGGTEAQTQSFNCSAKTNVKLIFAERTNNTPLSSTVFTSTNTNGIATLVYEGTNETFINSINAVKAGNKTVVLYNPTTNTLTVGKNGELTGFNDGEHTNRAWEKYANKCEKLVIADGTTGMGKRCFKDFTNLSTVVLPEGITRVNSYAFENTNVSVWNLPASLVTPPDGNAVKGFVISSKAYIVYPGTDDISGCFDIAENADVNIYTLANSAFCKEDENYHILTPGINNLGGEYAAVYNTGDAAVEGNIIDAQYTADKESLVTASVKPISVPAGVVRCTGLDAKNANTVVRGIFCFDNDMITPIYNNVSFN